MPKDYYKILGVDYSANEHEIKSAYRNRVKKNHPDTNWDKSQANASIIEIYDAYKTLSNNEKRKVYDAFLIQRLASHKTPSNRRYKLFLVSFLIITISLLAVLVGKKISQNEAINNKKKNQKEILKENTPQSSQEIKF